ncbi:MAG: L-arabinose ABC transporter permease AraH [Planctomycetota bacterium]|nr:L-arabinose ABC transporter permease AraH [Planctomycetota bacterium]
MRVQPKSRDSRLREMWDTGGMLLLFLVMFAVCWLAIPNFNSRNNMIGLSESITTVGIVACGMLFCLASGDFDLSVGSTLALSAVASAMAVNYTHSIFLGVVSGMAIGAIVGVFNGVIIAWIGINALITTLATMQIVRGLAYLLPRGKSVSIMQDDFVRLGSAMFIGVPASVWVMIVCFVFFGLLLHKTVFGRNTLAIGGNREAAQLAGVAVVRTKIIIFAMQGLIAGLAGVVVAAQESLGDPKEGDKLELNVIAACVLGGVSLTGGTGTILAVIVGALIMGTVKNAMNLENIDPFYQYLVSGGILLSAVLLDRLKQRGKN